MAPRGATSTMVRRHRGVRDDAGSPSAEKSQDGVALDERLAASGADLVDRDATGGDQCADAGQVGAEDVGCLRQRQSARQIGHGVSIRLGGRHAAQSRSV